MSEAISIQQAQPPRLSFTSRLSRIEHGRVAPSARTVLHVIVVLFVVLLLWSLTAKLDIVAVAQGRLVPQTYVKIVQPSDAGIVREIFVREGQRVHQGDVLIRLDATVAEVDREALQRELAQHRLQLRRIEAQLLNRKMLRDDGDDPFLFNQVNAQLVSHQQAFRDSINQERAAKDRALQELQAARALLLKHEQALPSYQRSAQAYADLAQRNLIGKLQADERQREASEKVQELSAQRATVGALEAAVRQSTERLSQLENSYRSDLNGLRLETLSLTGRLVQDLAKADFRSEHLELRAPQDGVVKDLATTTTGAVVQPGSVLLTLVPIDEPLRAEVLVENKDIGFVRERQRVRLKIAPYAFQKYGVIDGAVVNVSADSGSTPAAAQPAGAGPPALTFKAIIELDRQQLQTGGLMLPLLAGMQVSAEIVQGERTVAEYLLSPIRRIGSEMGQER